MLHPHNSSAVFYDRERIHFELYVVLDVRKIAALRAQGVGLRKIAAEMGIGVGTIYEANRRAAALLGGAKAQEKVF